VVTRERNTIERKGSSLIATHRESGEALRRSLEHLRFEVIPIKGVEEQVAYLPAGSKVTVTCSPTRGIEHTLGVAEKLAMRSMTIVPHIAARLVRDEAHLRDLLQHLSALRFREVFVIGGDAKEPVGRFSGALQLLRAMAEIGHDIETIGVPAYPERHPLMDDATVRQALRDKQMYAGYMVTQICFDPSTIVTWLVQARGEGIHLPVYIGIPGNIDMQRLLRISMKIGVGDSLRFASKHTNIAARLLRNSSYRPDEIIEHLGPYLSNPAYGVAGLHLNTFNAVDSSEQWRHCMLQDLGA